MRGLAVGAVVHEFVANKNSCFQSDRSIHVKRKRL
jgi:hypothetical protein